jgi:hypothetical protein
VDDAPDPWTIVDSLTRWASETEWCDWLELAGSLGRGAGDEWSDVDAGLGVDLDGATYLDRRDAVLDAAREFADGGGTLIQPLTIGRVCPRRRAHSSTAAADLPSRTCHQ